MPVGRVVALLCVVAAAVAPAGCGGAPGGGRAPTSTAATGPSSPSVPTPHPPDTVRPTPSVARSSGSAAWTTARPAPSGGTSRPPPATGTAPPAGLLGRVVDRIPTPDRVVALTFDAGANADGVASILATLRGDRVPATFFLTGDFARRYPTAARQLAAAGPVGDHTVSHPHLPSLSDAQVREQVSGARDEIRLVTGVDPRPLFRFPFGDTNARVLSLVNGLGYVAVGWTVDTLGWEGAGAGVSVASIVRRVVAALAPGAIVLMHVGSNPVDHTTLDADALGRLVAAVRADGYRFTTLRALPSR